MKRSRMKPGTGKNRRGCLNESLCDEYRENNDKCELLPLFFKAGIVVRSGFFTADTWQRTELHHIFGGKQRWDLKSNLITLNFMVHGCAAHGTDEVDMRIGCLFSKWKKTPSELDVAELNQAAGMARPDAQPVLGWLERHPSGDGIFDDWRLALIEEIQRRIQ